MISRRRHEGSGARRHYELLVTMALRRRSPWDRKRADEEPRCVEIAGRDVSVGVISQSNSRTAARPKWSEAYSAESERWGLSKTKRASSTRTDGLTKM